MHYRNTNKIEQKIERKMCIVTIQRYSEVVVCRSNAQGVRVGLPRRLCPGLDNLSFWEITLSNRGKGALRNALPLVGHPGRHTTK